MYVYKSIEDIHILLNKVGLETFEISFDAETVKTFPFSDYTHVVTVVSIDISAVCFK